MNDKLKEKNKLIRQRRTVRKIIKICSFIIVTSFSLKALYVNMAFDIISKNSDVLLFMSIGIYFSSWVFGSNFDADLLEEVYVSSINKKKFNKNIILYSVTYSIIYIFFCFLTLKRNEWFILALIIFQISDLIGWIKLNSIIKKPMKKSYIEFIKNKDNKSVIALNIVKKYICGKWRCVRFIFMISITMLISILELTNFKISRTFNNQVIINTLIFSEIVIVEVWIWLKRISSKKALLKIEEVTKKYKIIKDT